MTKTPVTSRARLIYNPNAGKKRRLSGGKVAPTLEEVKSLLDQYQIPVDLAPTKGPGHATELAAESVRKKYNLVLAAGGDGTVSEVATGLIGTDSTLGILPLGSFMNVAWMLEIPLDIEKAVEIIKIGRTRKIDVGQISPLVGGGLVQTGPKKEEVKSSYYFLENAGIGLEAQLQVDFAKIEHGNWSGLRDVLTTIMDYYGYKIKIILDDQIIETRAPLVEISNGPRTDTAIHFAPKSKLNDHVLTVSIFRMTKWELLNYFLSQKLRGKLGSRKITRYQSKTVKVFTRLPRVIHADAHIFGTTPVEFKIIPNALNVIAGFPKMGESSLMKRTYLDP